MDLSPFLDQIDETKEPEIGAVGSHRRWIDVYHPFEAAQLVTVVQELVDLFPVLNNGEPGLDPRRGRLPGTVSAGDRGSTLRPF